MTAIRSLGNWRQWRYTARPLSSQQGRRGAEPCRRAFATGPALQSSALAERDDAGAYRPERVSGQQPVARTVGVLAPSDRYEHRRGERWLAPGGAAPRAAWLWCSI